MFYKRLRFKVADIVPAILRQGYEYGVKQVFRNFSEGYPPPPLGKIYPIFEIKFTLEEGCGENPFPDPPQAEPSGNSSNPLWSASSFGK